MLIILRFQNQRKNFHLYFNSHNNFFLLICCSTVNRPDAGLYHLYTSIINENKIIFGITNLHFRFGHVSIIQYLSSAFNNYILPIEAITIPIALIFLHLFILYMKN